MALKVQIGEIELKDANKHYLSALTVGTNDIVLIGKHKDCVRWLISQNKPLRTASGHGDAVHIIIRKQAPRLNETILSSVAGALGISPMSMISAGIPSGVFESLSSTVTDMIASEASSEIDSRITDACSNKKVHVYLSAAKGCFATHGAYKGMIATLPSGLSSRFAGGALAALTP